MRRAQKTNATPYCVCARIGLQHAQRRPGQVFKHLCAAVTSIAVVGEMERWGFW